MASETMAKLMNDSEMDIKDDGFYHLEPIPTKYGVTVIFSSMFFFQIVNKVIVSITGLDKKYSEMSKSEWQRRNLLISWIHAFIVSVWDLIAFYLYWEEFNTDLVDFHNMFIYMLIAFSTGYFFYDFVDIVLYKGWLWHWEVLAHHMAVTMMFGYNVVICNCLPFTCVALLAEVNSFFLHSRKLLQLYKFPFEHWLYRLASALNLLSFPPARFYSLGVIIHGMFTIPHRVSPHYYKCLFCSIFVMTGINLVLFYRLVKSDVLHQFKKKPQQKSQSQPDSSTSVVDKNSTATASKNEKVTATLKENGTVLTSRKKQNGGLVNGDAPGTESKHHVTNNNGHVSNGYVTHAQHNHQD